MSFYIEAIEKMFGNFKALTTTKTVVGEPVVVGDRTIIPLIQAVIGFGGGGGEGALKDKLVKKRKGDTQGNFSGIGGGMRITPVALLIVDKDGVSFIRVNKGGTGFDKLVETIPEVIDKFIKRTPRNEE